MKKVADILCVAISSPLTRRIVAGTAKARLPPITVESTVMPRRIDGKIERRMTSMGGVEKRGPKGFLFDVASGRLREVKEDA